MFFFLRGGSQNSKFSQFQTFPKLGTRGGHQISNFSQIQKGPNHPRGGGGGGKKIGGFFPLFGTFLGARAPLGLAPVREKKLNEKVLK